MLELAMKVYVLGAGASVHARYLLASALGTSLAAWIENEGFLMPAQPRRILTAWRSRLNGAIEADGIEW